MSTIQPRDEYEGLDRHLTYCYVRFWEEVAEVAVDSIIQDSQYRTAFLELVSEIGETEDFCIHRLLLLRKKGKLPSLRHWIKRDRPSSEEWK